ncbi:MAG: hypothetical protein KKA73_13985 [Chloroflexi bacterium]|nr:hypothetical protein [Chloroflexota bacterium]MBU1748794.1 hypothetical protein [Chloroflexota bacterium]
MPQRRVTTDNYQNKFGDEPAARPFWQRLTPLAWVGVFALLVLCLGVSAAGLAALGYWQALNNPIAATGGTPVPFNADPTPAQPIYPWTMHRIADASGAEKWLPDDPRVAEEAIAAYLGWWEWGKETAFDLDRKLAEGPRYLTGEELVGLKYVVEKKRESGETAVSAIERDTPRVDYFTADGLTAYLVNRQTGGTATYYRLDTREKLREEALLDLTLVVTMQYDQSDHRWKIAKIDWKMND